MMLCVNSIRNKHYWWWNSWPTIKVQRAASRKKGQKSQQKKCFYISCFPTTYWLLSIPTCSYLNGTIKIRGGSSWTVSLRLVLHCIPSLSREQSGSLILCHAHTVKTPKKFVFSTQKWSWPEAEAPSHTAFFDQLSSWRFLALALLACWQNLIQAAQRERLRDVFCDKQRNFTLKRLFQSKDVSTLIETDA